MRHPYTLFTLTIGLALSAIAWAPATTVPTNYQATSERLTPSNRISQAARSLATATSTPANHGETAAAFDQRFIDMMVPHHQGAVEMARIAQDRAQHQEIRALADDIVRSQATEIDQMKAWRKAWFGSEETPPISEMPMLTETGQNGHSEMGDSAPTMNMAADVDALRAAEEPFDRAFIDAMIPHHHSAIDAANLALTQAERPEIRQLAQAIIAAQEHEIALMRQWRDAWYGEGDSPPAMSDAQPSELPRTGGGAAPLLSLILAPLGAAVFGGGIALRRRLSTPSRPER